MPFIVGEVAATVGADQGPFNRAMRDVRRKGERTADSVHRDFDRMSRRIASVTATAFAGLTTALGIISYKSVQAASDAEEIGQKFDVVFSGISEKAQATSKHLERSFGLSSRSAQKLLGDVGDILTGFGFTQETALDLSKQVNELAVDLASFTNYAGGAEGASQALTKALLGEAESVKALGIVIRQDTEEYKNLVAQIQRTNNVGLIQAKALAALQIATEQSKNAIGDFARTEKSLANQQRVSQERIISLTGAYGDLVIEATGLDEILGDVNDEMIDLTTTIENAEVPTSELKDEFRGWYVVIRELPGLLKRTNEEFGAWNRTINAFQTGGLSEAGNWLGEWFRESIREIGRTDRFLKQFGEEWERFRSLDSGSSGMTDIDERLNNIVNTTKNASNASADLSFTNEEVLASYLKLKPAVDNIKPTDEIFDPSVPEEFNMSLNDINSNFQRLGENSHFLSETKKELEEGKDAARFFSHTLADGLQQVLFTADNVNDAIKGIIRQLASREITSFFMRMFGLSGIGTGSILGSIFGGFRASGGSVSSGRSYIVGEQGPEMFVPNTSGSIVPNGAMGGRQVIEVHVNGTFTQRGTDLEAVIREVQRQQGRLN